jgi:hypothetical protein
LVISPEQVRAWATARQPVMRPALHFIRCTSTGSRR